MEQSNLPAQTNLQPRVRLRARLLAALRAGPGTVLSIYLRVLAALRMGWITRRYWKGFAAFWVLATLVAMTWAWNAPAGNAGQASILSAAWWTAPIELNAWKKYPAFENATIRVSEIHPTTKRVWIAGDNGLLAYRDDRGTSWTLFSFDTQNGCFHASGTPCTAPPPETPPTAASAGSAPKPSGATGATTGTTEAATKSGAANGASGGSAGGAVRTTAPTVASPGKTGAVQPNGNPTNPNPPADGNAKQMIQQAAPNAAPSYLTVAIVSPAEGETVSGNVAVRAAVSGTSAQVKLDFRLDYKMTIGGSADPPYTISFDTTKFPNGKYQLTVAATSADGATATSKPVTIVIANGAKKAAAAFHARPKEFFGARLQLASFSVDANASEKPPAKSKPPQAGPAAPGNPPARPPAQPAAWLKTVPELIGLDVDAKPSPVLVASDGRFFESADGGSSWTLSRTLGVGGGKPAANVDISQRVGRRLFHFADHGAGLPWTSVPDQIVRWSGGPLLYSEGPLYDGVELFDKNATAIDRKFLGESIQAVAATSDAKHLWFAAKRADGTSHIERSDDLGKTWSTEFQSNKFTVFDLSFDAAGQSGIAVGDLGVILQTTNGGSEWTPITRGAADPDRERAAEKAGAGGSLQTQDLDDLLFSHYWKLPPAWTFLLLLLALGAATPAIALAWAPVQPLQRPGSQTIRDFLDWWDSPGVLPKAKPPSVANEALSDRPLEDEDADQLQFTPLARGLSGFLSNPKTLLPVTIAIQGGWGTGKSSLMNLLRRELNAIGFRPVWFNAWHHQEDENLLASLLQTVRSEAVPGFFSTMGPWFRLRLAGRRAARNLQGIFAMLFVLMVLCGAEYCWHNIPHEPIVAAFAKWNASIQDKAAKIGGGVKKPEAAATTANNQPSTENKPAPGGTSAAPGAPPAPNTNAPAGGQEPGPAGTLLGYLLALLVNSYSLLHTLLEPAEALSFGTYLTGPLPALYVLFRIVPSAWKQLRAFGENPANLLHTAAPGASDKQLSAQTSFRSRFAKQFDDVTLALGDRHRLVIFVDDLDRCRPAKVGELLEDLNYVVTAGPCAVVLGIEPQAVRAALGLNFRETAEEREEVSGPDLLTAAHAKRAAFAERYVEKLINIELNVPRPTDEELEKLLQAAQVRQPTPSQRRAQAVVRWGRRFEPVLVGLILAGLGWGIGEGTVIVANWRAVAAGKTAAQNSALTASVPAGQVVLQPSPAGSPQDVANVNGATPAATGGAGGSPPPAANTRAALPPLAVDAESPFPGVWLTGWRLWVTLPAFVLALLWPATRERRTMAKDSQKFEDARQVWAPVIIQRYQTPRAIKRFMNRLRYLAMLEHPPKLTLPFLEQWVADRALEPETSMDGIPEDLLVALASLEAVTPDLVVNPEEFYKVLGSVKPEERVTIEATLKNHDRVFGNVKRFAEYFAAYSDLRRGIASHRGVDLSASGDKATAAMA